MILAVIPAHIVKKGTNIPPEFLAQIDDANLGRVLVLDDSQLGKAPKSAKKHDYPIKIVDTESLLMEGEPDFPEFAAVQKMAQETPNDCVLVLDTAALHIKTVYKLLNIMRLVWFHLPHWPKAIFIVCNEGDAIHLARHMVNVFLVSAVPLAPYDIHQTVNKIKRRASILRALGNGKMARSFYSLYRFMGRAVNRIRNFV